MRNESKRRRERGEILGADRFYVTRDPSPGELRESVDNEVLLRLGLLRSEVCAMRSQIQQLTKLVETVAVMVTANRKGVV